MAVNKAIPLSNLFIDTENPRFEDSQQSQNDAIKAVAINQDKKLVNLAKDILERGLNPSEFLIVIPFEEDDSYYTVLEGNRRIAALKILENPQLISGATSTSIFNQFKSLSERWRAFRIEEVDCTIVSSRSEADHWIELKHTGQNEGIGIVNWGGAERERFRRRRGRKSPHLQVLDFLEQHGSITREVRQNVPVTGLQRLIGTPYVRTKLGIDLHNGIIRTRYPDDDVAKGLKRVIEDLASGNTPVREIYTRDNRIAYIDKIPREYLPDLDKPYLDFRILGDPTDIDKQQGSEGKKTGPSESKERSKPQTSKRKTLIPSRGFALRISLDRVNEIYHELRKLDVEDYPNAVSVLFRVFLELSVDEFVNRHQLNNNPNLPLSRKMEEVAGYLINRGDLNDQQVKPVRRAIQKDSFLCSTVTTMHQYVHNQYFHPSPRDLTSAWDSLVPFMKAIWNLL